LSSFYIQDDVDQRGITVVVAAGEIDYAASPQLKDKLFAVLEAGQRTLVLDLTDATFIDSTAIGVLMAVAMHLREHDREPLAIVCQNQHVLQIFEITGLYDAVSIHDSRQAAVSTLASSR
jgi:anti-sigma B factor antagonist